MTLIDIIMIIISILFNISIAYIFYLLKKIKYLKSENEYQLNTISDFIFFISMNGLTQKWVKYYHTIKNLNEAMSDKTNNQKESIH